jgi:hypothetical protein
MALPASLLQQIEQHPCFSGCYSSELEGQLCLDGARPLQPILMVSCLDCLSFKVGVLRSLLAAGSTAHALANLLSQHMRQLRGFSLAFSGYHARGPGFWLSAAYYSRCGVFLIDGARSRPLGTDLDLLMLAFKHGVTQPPDPLMLDPKQYQTQTVYVNFATPLGPIANRLGLLASPQCHLQPKAGFQRVTLAEFQPIARQAPAAKAPAPAAGTPAPAAPKKPLPVGSICPVCKAEVRARPLLNGTYVGCLC